MKGDAKEQLEWRMSLISGPLPLATILDSADPGMLEGCHTWIQWAFPLDTPSRAVPGSPVLTHGELAWLAGQPVVPRVQRTLLHVFREFLDHDSTEWKKGPNHNRLRISRAIRSLRLMGMEEEAEELYRWVVREACANGSGPYLEQALIAWNDAVNQVNMQISRDLPVEAPAS